MYIARILYPIRVLGPGKRIGIWFNGCLHRCPGCSNPELWETQERYKISFETLKQLVKNICQTQKVDGFTLTGGDPFAQPEALRLLLPELRQICKDILVYTGYDFSYVKKCYPDLIAQIDVLIDGEYLESRNTGMPLRGSDNQNIIILNTHLTDKYREYLANARNEIQNFTASDGTISVGIHKPGYEAQLDAILRQKGLKNI